MSLDQSSRGEIPGWVLTQKKTFTGWCNNYLVNRQLKINDLTTDLKDGLLMINLLEEISNKKMLKYNPKPRFRVQEIENCSKALDFIKREGIKLVSIGPEDICDGKLKLILGMMWTLILRYEINRSGGNVKNDLLDWIRLRVAPYGLNVGNFKDDWADGKLISALVDSFKPGSLKIEGDPLQLAMAAMTFAEKDLKIPMILDPNDMVKEPDDLSILTYLFFYKKLEESADQGDEIIQYVGNFKFVLVGQGLKEGKCGHEKSINITITDKKTNAPSAVTADQIEVKIIGPEMVTCSVNEGKAGEIKCYYKVLNEPGDYTVEINYKGQSVDKVVVPWAPPDVVIPYIPPEEKKLPEIIKEVPLVNDPVITLPVETNPEQDFPPTIDLSVPSPDDPLPFPTDLTPTQAPDDVVVTDPAFETPPPSEVIDIEQSEVPEDVTYNLPQITEEIPFLMDTMTSKGAEPEVAETSDLLSDPADTLEQARNVYLPVQDIPEPDKEIQIDTPEPALEIQMDTPEPVREIQMDTPEPATEIQMDTPEPVREIDTPEPVSEIQIDTPEPVREIDTPEPVREIQIDTPEPPMEVQIDTPEPPMEIQSDTPEPAMEIQIDTPEPAMEIQIDPPETVREILDIPEPSREFQDLDTSEPASDIQDLDTPDSAREFQDLDTSEPASEIQDLDTPEPVREFQDLDTPEQFVPPQENTPEPDIIYDLSSHVDTSEPASEFQVLDTPEPAKEFQDLDTPEPFVPPQVYTPEPVIVYDLATHVDTPEVFVPPQVNTPEPVIVYDLATQVDAPELDNTYNIPSQPVGTYDIPSQPVETYDIPSQPASQPVETYDIPSQPAPQPVETYEIPSQPASQPVETYDIPPYVYHVPEPAQTIDTSVQVENTSNANVPNFQEKGRRKSSGNCCSGLLRCICPCLFEEEEDLYTLL